MQFDLENKGSFFEFEDGSGGVTVRLCTPEDFEKIQDETTTEKRKKVKGKWEKITKPNEKLAEKMIFFHCIVDWNGVKDGHGVELECNDENKLKMMKKSIPFATFFAECIESLTNEAVQEGKEQEKN
jgi:hypothetical protein